MVVYSANWHRKKESIVMYYTYGRHVRRILVFLVRNLTFQGIVFNLNTFQTQYIHTFKLNETINVKQSLKK